MSSTTAVLLNSDAISHCAACGRSVATNPVSRVLLVLPDNHVFHVSCYEHHHQRKLVRRHHLISRLQDHKDMAKIHEALLTAAHLDSVCEAAPKLILEQAAPNDSGELSPATYQVDALDRWDAAFVSDRLHTPGIPRRFWGEGYTVLSVGWSRESWGFNVPACIREWFQREAARVVPSGVHLYLAELPTECHIVIRVKKEPQVPSSDHTHLKYGDLADAKRDDIPVKRLLRTEYAVQLVSKNISDYIQHQTARIQFQQVIINTRPVGDRIVSRVDVVRHAQGRPECLLLVDRQAVRSGEFLYSYVFVGEAYDLYRVVDQPRLVVWPYHCAKAPAESVKIEDVRVSGKE